MPRAIIGVAVVALLLTAGCSGLSKQEQRILSGSAIGTAAGIAAGAATGGLSLLGGAAIGAAAGAAVGYVYHEVVE
jgi:uncharacterized lipoprotein